MADHPRLFLPGFMSTQLCEELKFIHKSNCAVGYRPHVLSTILSHLIATNSSHLILPLVDIREKLKERVEEFFGCEFELFIEFTGLISWSCGSSIGWHSDDNRPYLKQRHFAAVCYLSNHSEDFKGGLFHFQEGEPATIVPMAGDVLIYTADDRNIHCVDEITEGERLTLTLWFTRDISYDEDAKLLNLFSLNSKDEDTKSWIPLSAPNNMYWFSPSSLTEHHLGYDIRWARVHALGFDLYISNEFEDVAWEPCDMLDKPLKLGREGKIFGKEFANALHAHQVLEFYRWKGSELQASKSKMSATHGLERTHLLSDITSYRKLAFPAYFEPKSVFSESFPINSYCQNMQPFDWSDFSMAVALWEDYVHGLRRKLVTSLPQWKLHGSIFNVPLPE
ncbi:hypothetical protein AMTRI_Chr04g244250 [Amborella trichopoda]|uniref:procollagen-proline 3-dioxygenase n=1 Tax=Amborella trichopoda TaxID=13333 RepID=W1PTI2_AMBTC|nr:uncharacterized protein LOC18439200 [Amborella trichopoda]ERN11016.1 hypothetical protein AMTR_s00024p00042310 [Amborella trichopoda]|eukprot:XP_006849435.1 uncharacterized protein LOC18439200 [Amborella trichopoda]